jgi:hypothetical protein
LNTPCAPMQKLGQVDGVAGLEQAVNDFFNANF